MINTLDSRNIVKKISLDTDVRKAIDHIEGLFKDKGYHTICICGLSLAISKVILISEIVKTHVAGLHQITNIDCLVTKKGDGEVKRTPKLDIILTRNEPDFKGMGYQKPLTFSEIRAIFSVKSKYNQRKRKRIFPDIFRKLIRGNNKL